MLTLNLSLPVPPIEAHYRQYRTVTRRRVREAKNIPAWEKELQTIFCRPRADFHNHVLIFESFFKWKFNGCLNLQHSAQSYIAFAMHKWLAPSVLFSAHWRFDYIICNANSIKNDFLRFFLCLFFFKHRKKNGGIVQPSNTRPCKAVNRLKAHKVQGSFGAGVKSKAQPFN